MPDAQYPIGKAALAAGVSTRTLRYYEELGLVTPHRTTTNRRRYSQRDIRRLQVIQHLTRERGVNLAGVRHILSLLEVMHKANLQPHADLKQAYAMYREIL